MILDSTCSLERKWPVHADIRIDINKIAKPDIVADAGTLPFRSSSFDQIYCDPPHIGYPGKKTWAKHGIMAKRFGFWINWAAWYSFLERTNSEFARCLKTDGFLIYKLLDGLGGGTTKLKHLSRLTNFVVMTDEPEQSKGISKRSKVHYIVYRKKGVFD